MSTIAVVLAVHVVLFWDVHLQGALLLAAGLVLDLGGLVVLRTAAFRDATRVLFRK
jgi:hypothetical protein